VHAGSREASELAQWLFALYVSLAMTYATRAHAHLAADALARRYSLQTRARLIPGPAGARARDAIRADYASRKRRRGERAAAAAARAGGRGPGSATVTM